MKKYYLFGLILFPMSWGIGQEAVLYEEPTDTLEFEDVNVRAHSSKAKRVYLRDEQILTIAEIKQLPVTSINELLAYVGGVDIRQRGPMGGQADISIDGGTFEQTTVLLNGIKLINSQTAHNLLNLPIPFDAIERIEILKGSAAMSYGINALTGVVNIVTKKEQQSFIDADIYAGSSFQAQDEREGSGIYGGGGIQVTGGYGSEKQSHLISVSKDNGNGHHYNSAVDRINFLYDGEYRFNERNSLQLIGGYADNKFGANGFYAAPGDSNSVEFVKTALVGLSSRHKLGKYFTLAPMVSNRYDEDDYRYFKDNPDVARSMHYSNALMADLNSSAVTHFGTFQVNLSSRFETINSSNIGKHDRNNYGLSANYLKAWRDFIFGGGAYVNYNTSYGWQVYPTANVYYGINDNGFISAVLGSGQRIPSFTDLYLNQAPGNIGNPNLRPESAWIYEFNGGYRIGSWMVEVGYFYRDVFDFIDWVRVDETVPYAPENYGNAKVHGVYLRTKQSFVINEQHHLGYFVNYQYLHPKIESKGDLISKYIIESLKHQLQVGLSYSVSGFAIQLTNRLIQRELNSAYDVLDLRLSYKVKAFTIYGDVSNMLDAKYLEAGAVPMPGRWFKLGLRYSWRK